MFHVLQIMANNSSVPYFNWYAESSMGNSELKLSFISMNKIRPVMLDEMKKYNCKCYWIKFDPAKRKRSMLKNVFELLFLFKKIKPDIIHCHLFDDSLPSLIAAWLCGIKVRVITKQDTTFHWYFKPYYVLFDKINNKIATHIHVVADNNKKFVLEKEKAPSEKVHLIRNGFPYNKITAYDKFFIQEINNKYQLYDKFVVGTVARLIKWKGHELIIEAAETLVKKIPEIVFLWAGTGEDEYKKNLQKCIDDRGLNKNIIFTGWIERSMMPSLYRCLDVYLHPAINEPFGFSIAEALMNEVPVAATKTGSVDLITHKINAYILDENSVESIINSILFYFDQPEKSKIIAAAGNAYALKNLTFEKMWREQIEFYKNALK